jgi:hypothetical protein
MDLLLIYTNWYSILIIDKWKESQCSCLAFMKYYFGLALLQKTLYDAEISNLNNSIYINLKKMLVEN